ncbi:MAG: TIGR02391 family protein [Ignavibacteria bacterium]
MRRINNGIQYYGLPGTTEECKEAVIRLLQNNKKILKANILSYKNRHCFLFFVDAGDPIIIKSGFTSGYLGTGPNAFSYILQLLDIYNVEIEEYKIKKTLLNRIDNSLMLATDLEELEKSNPVIPTRWYDYIHERDENLMEKGKLWKEFHPIIPFAIIDARIADLAINFWDNPDEKLLTGYRRLEDIVRNRTGLDEHSTKLFAVAFKEALEWKKMNAAEQNGRIQLFYSIYTMYRNPRAHKELDKYDNNHLLSEFLLLNHLYKLEDEAVDRT